MNSRDKSQSATLPMAQSLPGDAVAGTANASAPLLGAGGRTISEAIVTRLVATFDGASECAQDAAEKRDGDREDRPGA